MADPADLDALVVLQAELLDAAVAALAPVAAAGWAAVVVAVIVGILLI